MRCQTAKKRRTNTTCQRCTINGCACTRSAPVSALRQQSALSEQSPAPNLFMQPALNFSQILRPVGQMLEPLNVDSLSLRVEESGVSVRAHQRPQPVPPANDVS